MTKVARNISYTPVNIKVFDFRSKKESCPDCERINSRHKELKRTAIDIDLDEPTAIVVLYNTFLCKNPKCRRKHYQSDNPLVKKGGRYTNRAKEKTIKSVTEDGVTIRAARARAQRDFNISPANATISRWTSSSSPRARPRSISGPATERRCWMARRSQSSPNRRRRRCWAWGCCWCGGGGRPGGSQRDLPCEGQMLHFVQHDTGWAAALAWASHFQYCRHSRY